MHGADTAGRDPVNPPGAARMAVIAFLSFNLSMGCMFGPFGVLIAPIEQRLDVTREISTLAIPVVTFGMSLLAPIVGGMTNRVSLRLMMLAGSLLMAAGFAVLAVASSVAVFVGAYALLVSPGLCICGIVAPTTLVTRWFRANRGRALGLTTTPALMAATPLLVTLVLGHFGLSVAYALLAGLMLLCLVASLFTIDHPGQAEVQPEAPGAGAQEADAAGAPASARILRDGVFWRLALAGGLYNAVIVMFSTQLVPFAIGEGIDPTRAALLLTAYLVGTLIGTPIVGSIADKVGGARMIGLLSLSLMLWQGLLLLHGNYVVLVLLAGVAGLQGAAMISCMGLALSQQFGQAGFAKAYGIGNLVGLPFGVLSVPIASAIFVRTASYDRVFLVAVAALLIAAVLALSIGRQAARPAP